MSQPLSLQRLQLPLVGALLQCLDEQQNPIPGASASGFVRREGGRHFLYTCWHVVTGFDPNDVKVGRSLPSRRYLRLALQAADLRQPGVESIGGLQTFDLQLYDSPRLPSRPRWQQDDQYVPNADLNAVDLFVPFWHDVVKIELPADVRLSSLQVVDETRLNTALVGPGDKCLVVGYPYGFSAFGPGQPTAIALTRYIAGDRVFGRRQNMLLESIGAPGMSGGPVFVERGDNLLLFGLYTGSIFPDHVVSANEKTTALGTVCDLTLFLTGGLSLVSSPSQPVWSSAG